MPPRLRRLLLTVLTAFAAVSGRVNAQSVDEISLLFGYPAIGQVYINAAFRGEQPLIATAEFLNLAMIPFDRTDNRFGLKGAYPNKTDVWEIDPVKRHIIFKGKKVEIPADKFYIGEADLYVAPEILNQIFDIQITVNTYALMMSLYAERPLPVDEKLKRQAIRDKMKSNAPEEILKAYPMLYPRRRAFFAPGMFDYNVGVSGSVGFRQYNYSLSAGLEVLGGDIQGTVNGVSNERFSSVRASGVRWRYVFKGGLDPNKNPIISDITAGQIGLTGPLGGRVRGVAVSNTPVVPRRVLDLFAIEGFTTPDSEVELLIAGQLTDFTRADELGYYRFTTPITYGTLRIGIRIYTPQGEVLFEERQLQIPFTFVPRGVLNYNVQAGYEEFTFPDSLSTNLIGHGNLVYGLTNNITVRTGVDRRFDTLGVRYTPYGSMSARLFDQYLINLDVLPESFTRMAASVFYANSTSLNFQYTDYVKRQNTDLAILTLERDFALNYFFPFTVFKRTSGFRLGTEFFDYNNGQLLRYQVDFNTRIGPIVSRINFREERIQRNGRILEPQRLITGSFTYTIPRTPGIPVFVRGMFFRAQIRHDMKRFDATALGSLQFSQTILKNGRLTIGYDRDFLNKANLVQLGFLYDFQFIRSSTQSLIRQKEGDFDLSVSQNLSGSIGADLRNGAILPTNRDQVGRSGITVRMFEDLNANGVYDKGETIIPAKAVRLDQSATMTIGRDGLLRITQLQSYWTYRLTVDVRALPDATLLPLKTKFSFVADPNRFKSIDIPLYRTGTIEGIVYNERIAGRSIPQPGLRLILRKEGEEEAFEPIRTFSDGTFYSYGLMPGNYTLMVDSGQLAFMNLVQKPDTLKFTIRPLPEGDYIDTLVIRLVQPTPDSTKPDAPIFTLAELEDRLGTRLQESVRAFVESQELFYRGRYEQALVMVDSSINTYNTDVGLALKGSIVYLMGNKRGAVRLWEEARARNPFVIIPDTAKVSPLVDSLFDLVENKPFVSATEDTLANLRPDLVEQLEGELGQRLRAAITSFIEAQELFYRRRFFEAGQLVDKSISIYPTDHALALKGSISYITGNKREAWRMWEEARERNPHIVLPDIELLERLIKPITETTPRDPKKSYSLNR